MPRKRKEKPPKQDVPYRNNLGAAQDDDATRAQLDHIGAEGKDIDEDVKDIFQEAQELDFGREDLARKLESYTDRNPALTGGDIDASWEYSDVGEETVGGQNPTPDQSVVDEEGAAVGLTYQDNEPLGIDDKVGGRDREPWELNPASAPDYAERVNEEFNAPLENLGITPRGTGSKRKSGSSARAGAAPRTALRASRKTVGASRKAKPSRTGATRSAKGRSTGKRTGKSTTNKSRRTAPARARGTRR